MSINTRELHCPLCLKPLDDEDTLLVFKTGLDVASKAERYKTIACRGDFNREIVNFGGKLIRTPSGRNQVCLSHLNCDAENLFWKASQLSIPLGDGQDAEFDLDCQTTGANLKRKVSSDIIGTLRETGEYQNTHPNMWFPYPLLRASGKSSLVEMFGSKKVGKTILTLQLAHKELYLHNLVIKKMDVASYIFIHNPDDFKRELVIRGGWLKRPISRPSSTEPTPGDVRAIFINPSTKPESVSKKGKIIKEGLSKLGELRRRLQVEWENLIEALTNKENGSTSDFEEQRYVRERKASEIIGKDTEQFWHSVIFYDTAGESGRRVSQQTQRVWQYTDKLVICIDAQEIFNQVQEMLEKDESYKRNESIELAGKRLDDLLKDLPEDRKKTCLLITKLDLIPDNVLGNETSLEKIKDLIEREPKNDAEDRKIDGEIRRILRKWLSDNNDIYKQNLINHFQDDVENLIDKVFFVWTEGLPKMEGVRISPIEKFSPTTGKAGDKITIYPNKDYFNLLQEEAAEIGFEEAVKSVSFSGIEANILLKTAEKLEVIVPEKAKTGFIEIAVEAKFGRKKVVEGTKTVFIDEATSETVFSIDGDRKDGNARSYGMLRFLAWCVGEPIQNLVKLLPSQEREDSESKDGLAQHAATNR